jgi:hypothetical protein
MSAASSRSKGIGFRETEAESDRGSQRYTELHALAIGE